MGLSSEIKQAQSDEVGHDKLGSWSNTAAQGVREGGSGAGRGSGRRRGDGWRTADSGRTYDGTIHGATAVPTKWQNDGEHQSEWSGTRSNNHSHPR